MCRHASSDKSSLYVAFRFEESGLHLLPVLQSDYSGQLTMLLRYPALPSEAEASTDGMPHHTSLLLRQALAFQMSPTPTTGVSVVLENRNLLNIPLEVPESPPASDQVRRLGHTPREKSASTSDLSHGRGHLPRSPPPQFGFPEGIARGLLERGETLGINKSFMNAVSEFRVSVLRCCDLSLHDDPRCPEKHTRFGGLPCPIT